MTHILDAIVLEPAGTCDSVVIWLHGLGASGHDFAPIVPMLGLEKTRFIFPHAPEQAVTINRGFVMPSWFDIRSFEGPERENYADVTAMSKVIATLVDREADKVGANRVVLAGFSQGAALALHTAMRYPKALAGLMFLSGYPIRPGMVAEERSLANANLPVLVCHGTEDQMLAWFWVKQALDVLMKQHPAVELRTFEMGHEVCPEEIMLVRDWLHKRIG